MKIWGEIPKIFGIYDKQKNVNKVDKTSAVVSKKDVVSISNQAKDFQTVMRALKEVPEVREEKVRELSEKYEAGNYDVSGKDIAEKMLKSVFDTKA
jgi:negative regulator of flagellin synthesis FlgM